MLSGLLELLGLLPSQRPVPQLNLLELFEVLWLYGLCWDDKVIRILRVIRVTRIINVIRVIRVRLFGLRGLLVYLFFLRSVIPFVSAHNCKRLLTISTNHTNTQS